MKYKDWSNFRICCSKIHEIMSLPRNCRPFSEKQAREYAKLISLDDLTEKQQETLSVFNEKRERLVNPPLSKVAIEYLIRRYGFEKYNKRVAATGFAHPKQVKGNEMEDQSIDILSKIDKIKYVKSKDIVDNGIIYGVCDIVSPSRDKILEVKTSWNINTFLPNHKSVLSRNYWFQMQGYLELYDAEIGEICFVLNNTPQYLVDREMAKYTEKYVFGEISRDRYDEEMIKLEHCFNYNKIPIKRKVIRHQVRRCREVIPMITKKVEKCREWLNDYEIIHMKNENIIVDSELYLNHVPDEDLASDKD